MFVENEPTLLLTYNPPPPLYHEFAEAIRFGCKLHPVQVYGHLSEKLPDGSIGVCAIGAARAAGYDENSLDDEDNLWVDCPMDGPHTVRFGPRVTERRFGCGQQEKVYDMVAHLNDTHRWTREAIADWLETLE